MSNRKNVGQHRDSNIELYRIICMLLIVAHHYVVNSGLMAIDGPIQENPTSWQSIFLLLIGAWGKTGINCFVFITGWFMSNSRITFTKFVKLFTEVFFYIIVIFCVFSVSGYEPFSFGGFVKTIIPYISIKDGFTSCFLVYYIAIPFLNILMDNLDEKKHRCIILLVSFIYIALGSIHKVAMNYFTWFIVLHLIAGLIRRYPKDVYEKKNIWGIISFFSLILSCASVIAMVYLSGKYGFNGKYYLFVQDVNTLLPVITGISSFLFFKNLNMGYCSIINVIASSTFGVLLIHANSDTMRRWLWQDVLNNVGMYSSDLLVVHVIGSVIGVFIVCTLIDQIRIILLEKPFISWWIKHEEGLVEGLRKRKPFAYFM